MDLKDIRRIIDLMTSNDLTEFELESQGERIHVKRGGPAAPAVPTVSYAPPPAAAPAAPAPAAEPEPDEDEGLIPIKSPMVGTFYRSSSPDADPFVQPGAEVEEDSTVCIIEAMKVMNEIKAEVRGTVRKVLVENGEAVEFGQILFLADPR